VLRKLEGYVTGNGNSTFGKRSQNMVGDPHQRIEELVQAARVYENTVYFENGNVIKVGIH
jgi:hypothetical protein